MIQSENVTSAGWQSQKLSNLPIQIIDGDRSARYPKRSEFEPEGVLFLNTSNINLDRLDLTEANFVSQSKYNEIKKERLRPLDIVMTTRGTIGKVALFACGHATGLINAQMLILRADGDVIDPKFLFHIVRSPAFQASLRRCLKSASGEPPHHEMGHGDQDHDLACLR